MVYSRSSYSSLPDKAGVYVFLDKRTRVLYVGKANDLKARVSSYFAHGSLLGEKTKLLVSQIHKIKITPVESELEALLLEAFYIKKYRPKYNVRLTDSKSYILIRITMKDDFPKVLLARREDDRRSLYYGPYPNAGAVKLVLKIIRRVFPYQSVMSHPKRICLYYHLGLCPCPVFSNSSFVSTQEKQEIKNSYRKNIKGVIRILEGQSKKIMKELEKARDRASKQEDYEEALKIQKKINALSFVTQPFHKPFEYDVNPNLRVDIRQKELDGLRDSLNAYGFTIKQLQRIECYDISNTQGTHATGSLVVFISGEKEPSQYRRFKIRKDGKPDDFAMMKEVLQRRLRHDEWPIPDLIVVDGGKGQVSSAISALSLTSSSVPVIGLAKREETIIIPNLSVIAIRRLAEKQSRTGSPQPADSTGFAMTEKGENFQEISLSKNSPALHLLMRIRDEAHRFAITYHKKLRFKYMIT